MLKLNTVTFIEIELPSNDVRFRTQVPLAISHLAVTG